MALPAPIADQVALAAECARQGDAIGAELAAKHAGQLAGARGIPPADCPFTDPDLMRGWHSYHAIGRRGAAERARAAQASMPLFAPRPDSQSGIAP